MDVIIIRMDDTRMHDVGIHLSERKKIGKTKQIIP